MQLSSEALADKLHNKGIRPSYHRIRVLEYLYRKKENHPTADEVFEALSPDIPSLSKTTVYNALHIFVESGLARVVDIDDSEARYDTMLSDHGHFKCTACGAISNFAVDFACISIGGLDQFEIYEKNMYFKGLCPKCRNPKT